MSLIKNGWHLYDALDLFVIKASELQNTPFLQKEFSLRMTIGYSQEKGFYTESDELEESDIRSALVIIRQFISNKEPIQLNWICPYLVKFTHNEDYKNGMDNSFNEWKMIGKSGFGIIEINEKKYTPEYILNMYINGYYFHSDPKLYKEYQALTTGWMGGLIIHQAFQNCLLETIDFILYVSSYIQYVQEKGYLIIPDTKE